MRAAPFIFGAILAWVWFFMAHPMSRFIYADMGVYFNTAKNMAEGRFPLRDTFLPPGYSLLAAAMIRLGLKPEQAMPWLHWIAFILILVCVSKGCRKLYGANAGMLCAWICAFHFPLYSASGFFSPECFFALILSAVFLCLARPLRSISMKRWYGVGFLLGLGMWFKGLGVFIAPLGGICILSGPETQKAKAGKYLSLGLGFLQAVALLALFYTGAYGVTRFFPSNGGLNLVEGKCPSKYNQDSDGVVILSPLFYQLGEKTEKTWQAPFYQDDYYWSAGWDCLRSHPALLITEFRQVGFLFFKNVQWPESQSPYRSWIRITGRVFSGSWILVLLLTAVILGRKIARLFRPAAWVPILSVFILVWVFKAEIRYRVPFDGILIAVMAGAISMSFGRVRAYLRFQRRASRGAIPPHQKTPSTKWSS